MTKKIQKAKIKAMPQEKSSKMTTPKVQSEKDDAQAKTRIFTKATRSSLTKLKQKRKIINNKMRSSTEDQIKNFMPQKDL